MIEYIQLTKSIGLRVRVLCVSNDLREIRHDIFIRNRSSLRKWQTSGALLRFPIFFFCITAHKFRLQFPIILDTAIFTEISVMYRPLDNRNWK